MTSESIEISNLQPLRVLAITRARLQAVEAAYQQDPAALTDDVLEDAFRYGAPRGVLRYLVEKKGLDEQEISDLMAKIFLEEIPAMLSTSEYQ
ncbi:expressed unknown protein [Seminavis robusta]|uniref:Uncharacterized protein n=1 Tax=Seminavis robusta TaxID=568900 RepID=A0A9N8F4S9_9STRA|nr:expressed unknown protein [Seminavis robusta]|eukprot:Sro4237_g353480.1 n/a (93) ;mRNA; f:1541-1819